MMARHSLIGLLWLMALLLGTTHAATWKLSNAVAAGLQPWFGHPQDHPECSAEGVCKPYTTTVPKNTLWYWCGWTTKQATQYWVSSTGVPVTTLMMRRDELENCALANLTNIKACYQLENSLCDTSTSCYAQLMGMTFVDESCLLVANNNATDASVSIQVWQYYDSRRFYGTIFSALLFICILGATVGQMGWTCWHQIRKPNHRLDELERLTRAKLAASAPPNTSDASDSTASRSSAVNGVSTGSSDDSAGRKSSIGLLDTVRQFVLSGPAKGTHRH